MANLYDFANTLDLRHFVHHGVQHQQADAIGDPSALGDWLSAHRLGERSAIPSQKTFEAALRLRSAIRDYLQCDPAERRSNRAILDPLDRALQWFPLRVRASGKNGLRLQRADAEAEAQPGLSVIVAELYDSASNGTLDRLKMCAAEECQRVFYDRSKPGTRRWCQSTLCGNREKTRHYRERHRRDAADASR